MIHKERDATVALDAKNRRLNDMIINELNSTVALENQKKKMTNMVYDDMTVALALKDRQKKLNMIFSDRNATVAMRVRQRWMMKLAYCFVAKSVNNKVLEFIKLS